MSIAIVNASENDAEGLWELGHDSWELHPSKDSQWYTKDELRIWIVNPGRDILLVAKDKEKLVGMSLTSVFVGWAMCHDLFIAQEYRGLGIGRKIIDETVARLEKKEIGYLGLVVNVKNGESIKFYQANGFKKGFKFYWMYKRFKKT